MTSAPSSYLLVCILLIKARHDLRIFNSTHDLGLPGVWVELHRVDVAEGVGRDVLQHLGSWGCADQLKLSSVSGGVNKQQGVGS